ncbi:hypothetical protein ANCDUO_15039 [Ancylostoma duodenale]|uniref:MATH domain-containing protein n=1 Tax=Ancylostoma duodenale TaxID=51022 RepID=A0A0C2CYA6_9BILA|nr:hypothetical protein ANCDUO_15039 [Ancylostoma duodenale]
MFINTACLQIKCSAVYDFRLMMKGKRTLKFEPGKNQSTAIRTRSCTFPLQTWQWTLKLAGSSYSNAVDDVLKAYLISEDIDQPRSIEYMLSIVDEKRVLRSWSSKKNFTKTSIFPSKMREPECTLRAQTARDMHLPRPFSAASTINGYSSELDIDRKVEINDLLTEDSPLLVNGELHLQITLRPID